MISTNGSRNVTESVFKPSQSVQILALNGGGLKGLYTATVIKKIEELIQGRLADKFDLIVGTSTGGLIGLGLSAGMSGEDLQSFYLEHGNRIFHKRSWLATMFGVLKPRYSNANLESVLKNLFGTSSGGQPLLRDLKKRMVVPTYIANDWKPRCIKTPHASRYKYDWKLPLWAVGMATSAAPTYFPSFFHDGFCYLDGGIWANNPSIVGIVEALDLGATLDQIKVLNIGTTVQEPTLILDEQKWIHAGFKFWVPRLVDTFFDANSYSVSHMYLHQLLSRGNLMVIDDVAGDDIASLHSVDREKLIELGEQAGLDAFGNLGAFMSHFPAPYSPNKEAMS